MSNWFGYFAQHLGKRRFEKILAGAKLKKKHNLLESDLAKIIIGITRVKRDDMQEVLLGFHPPVLSILDPKGRQEILSHQKVEDLQPQLFTQLYKLLSYPFLDHNKEDGLDIDLEKVWKKVVEEMTPDIYCKVKEYLAVSDETMKLQLYQYYERLICYYAEKEELEIGSYVPASFAYPHCFYRVAGELITGGGQLGLFLLPATKAMPIPPLRLTRGSPVHPLKLDYISHAITDMEPEIGRRGYESGIPYQPLIDKIFPEPFMEVAFSIGGTIAQWRIAHDPHRASSAWLFKSPGVPKFVWEKFNNTIAENQHPMDLHIFRAKRDFIPYTGEYCLGYKAPPTVKVYLYLMQIPRINAHLYNIHDPTKAKIEKIEGDEVDRLLDNEQHSFFEKGRKRVGKHLVVPFLEKARDVLRVYTKNPLVHKVGFWFENRGPAASYTTIKRYTP